MQDRCQQCFMCSVLVGEASFLCAACDSQDRIEVAAERWSNTREGQRYLASVKRRKLIRRLMQR